MNGKLIAAGVLSLVGAGIPALFFGLSTYAVVFLPAFTIVLIVNIRGGRQAKAFWLGFLLFMLCILITRYLYFIYTITVLIMVILSAVFVLVFTSYDAMTDRPTSVNRRLIMITGFFFILAAIMRVIVFKRYLDMGGFSIEGIDPLLIFWPGIIVHYALLPILGLLFIILFFLENRLVYYALTPIVLVVNSLYALDSILPLFRVRLYAEELPRILSLPYLMLFSLDYFYYNLFAVLSGVMIVYFLKVHKA